MWNLIFVPHSQEFHLHFLPREKIFELSASSVANWDGHFVNPDIRNTQTKTAS